MRHCRTAAPRADRVRWSLLSLSAPVRPGQGGEGWEKLEFGRQSGPLSLIGKYLAAWPVLGLVPVPLHVSKRSVLVRTWAMTGTRIRAKPSICYLLVNEAKRASSTISSARDEVRDTWIDPSDTSSQQL